jgi:hypothetical protein
MYRYLNVGAGVKSKALLEGHCHLEILKGNKPKRWRSKNRVEHANNIAVLPFIWNVGCE